MPPCMRPWRGLKRLKLLCIRQFNNRSPSLMTEARYAADLTVHKVGHMTFKMPIKSGNL